MLTCRCMELVDFVDKETFQRLGPWCSLSRKWREESVATNCCTSVPWEQLLLRLTNPRTSPASTAFEFDPIQGQRPKQSSKASASWLANVESTVASVQMLFLFHQWSILLGENGALLLRSKYKYPSNHFSNLKPPNESNLQPVFLINKIKDFYVLKCVE